MDGTLFIKLAAELRIRIYELVLPLDHEILMHIPRSRFHVRRSCAPAIWGGRGHQPLAIASTCKQMRRECLAEFYSRNSFNLSMSIDSIDTMRYIATLRAWLLGLRDNIRSLKSLKIELNLHYCDRMQISAHQGPYYTYDRTVPARSKAIRLIESDFRHFGICPEIELRYEFPFGRHIDAMVAVPTSLRARDRDEAIEAMEKEWTARKNARRATITNSYWHPMSSLNGKFQDCKVWLTELIDALDEHPDWKWRVGPLQCGEEAIVRSSEEGIVIVRA